MHLRADDERHQRTARCHGAPDRASQSWESQLILAPGQGFVKTRGLAVSPNFGPQNVLNPQNQDVFFTWGVSI